MSSEAAREKILALTNREREMLALRCDGWLCREIAAYYVLDEGTVRSHFSHMFPKLGLVYVRSYQARWDIVKKVFCPVMAELAQDGTLDRLKQQKVEVMEVELQPPPEILIMVEADERYLLQLREERKVQPQIPAPLTQWQPHPKPADEIVIGQVKEIQPNPWRLAFILLGGIVLGAVLVGGAVWAWMSSQTTPTPIAVVPTAQPTQAPGITREVVVVTATPLPATNTPVATDTPVPTLTAQPTAISTDTPYPTPTDTAPGTLLPIGTSWRHQGVLLTLRAVEFGTGPNGGVVYLNLDMANTTPNPISVSLRLVDITMVDNNGVQFRASNCFPGQEVYNRTIAGSDYQTIGLCTGTDIPFVGNYFAANVTHLIVTIRNWSRIPEASWQIPITH